MRELADLRRSAGLPFALAMAFDTPGETEKTVSGKLDFLRQSKPQFATLRLRTRVLHGGDVADLMRSEGPLVQTPTSSCQPSASGPRANSRMDGGAGGTMTRSGAPPLTDD